MAYKMNKTKTIFKYQHRQIPNSQQPYPQYWIIPLAGIDIADGLAPTKGSTISSLNVKFHVNGLLRYWFHIADEYAIKWQVSDL